MTDQKKNICSGPMFEPKETIYRESCFDKNGAHYNIFAIKNENAMEFLKKSFPKGKTNEMSFILFSTSGVHGMYTTLEEIEHSLKKYGEDFDEDKDEEWPDDYHGRRITILIVQPRIVSLTYGHINITLKDIPFLKKIRKSSIESVKKINGG
jgi:hypothetical protein